jgi:hypothetical protein
MASGLGVIKFDPGCKRMAVACYAGAISVFRGRCQSLPDNRVFKGAAQIAELAANPGTQRVHTPEEWFNRRPAARLAADEAVSGNIQQLAEKEQITSILRTGLNIVTRALLPGIRSCRFSQFGWPLALE